MNSIYKLDQLDLKPLSKLITLDISYNNIGDISSDLLTQLVDLKHLNISGNPLLRIDAKHFDSLYQLESLYAYDLHQLAYIPHASAFGHLRHLKHFRFYNLPSLSHLNVSAILQSLPPLRSLHIEMKDELLDRQLHSADVRRLRYLSISGHRLHRIDTGAFAQLRGYRLHLQISDTSISEFADSIFHTLTSISFLSLDLSNNQLSAFNPVNEAPMLNQHGTILQDLSLVDNPLICCEINLEWINKWIKYMNTIDNEQKSMILTCVDDRGEKQTVNVDDYHLKCDGEESKDKTIVNQSNMETIEHETIISLILLHLAVFCMNLIDNITATQPTIV